MGTTGRALTLVYTILDSVLAGWDWLIVWEGTKTGPDEIDGAFGMTNV